MSWPSVTLDDVCEINVGRTPSRDESGYWDTGEHLWVSIGDMSRSRHITTTKEMFSDRARRECGMKPVAAGTVLMSFKLSIGKIAFAERELYTNEAIAALPVRNREQLDPKYLAFALEALNFDGAGKRAVMGTTLNKASLKLLKIPLPPLSEQRRIAAILDQADALRRLRRDSLDRLGDLGQAIFYEMFGDPITNPKALPTVKLSTLGALDRGVSRHRPRNDPALLGGPHPMIQTGDVSRADDKITAYSSTYSDLGLKQSKMWPRGTLCITIAANIADTAILDFDACFPDSVVGFNGKDDVVNFYVHCWFKLTKGELERLAPAVAQKNINLAILRELDIIRPSDKDLTEFHARMRTLSEQADYVRTEMSKLDELFASLQHRAFRGEL